MRNNYKVREEKCLFHTCITKLPDLEAEMKNWITDHRKKAISVSTKVIISKARRWAVTHSITDFVGTAWRSDL